MQFNHKNSGVRQSEIEASVKKLLPYLDQLATASKDTAYATPEACLALVNDNALLDSINQLVQKKKTPHLHEVMVVGIGGSSLGAQAIYRALRAQGAALSFYDTVDNHQLIQAITT